MNAAQKLRFTAIGNISRLWYNEDGSRTNREFDFATLSHEVALLRAFGRSAKWQTAVADWQRQIIDAAARFCTTNEVNAKGFPVREDFTTVTAQDYDHWFTWALFNHTTHYYV